MFDEEFDALDTAQLANDPDRIRRLAPAETVRIQRENRIVEHSGSFLIRVGG